MALYLVLLSTILAFSLMSTEQYVSSPDSNINLSLDSMKNASGHSITKVDTGRYTREDNPQPLSVNVHQEASNKTEQLDAVDIAHPSLHDTLTSGAFQLTASTSSATTPSSTTTTMTTTTNTSTTVTTTTTTSTTIITPSTATTNTSTTNSTTSSTTDTSSATTTTITITTTPDVTITTTTTVITTTTTTPKSCPQSGYQPYPEFNCYKAFPSEGERKNWTEARTTCTEDGGDLMVIETERERKEVYIPLFNSVNWHGSIPWVEVHIPQGGNDWTTVKGQSALSTWWVSGYPVQDAARKCAAAYPSGLLGNWNCASRQTFICEISL